jgi:hypothetical protein
MRQEALLEALEVLTRHDDLGRLFHELAQRLRKMVDFDVISVILAADPGPTLRETERLVKIRSRDSYIAIATLLKDLRQALAGT